MQQAPIWAHKVLARIYLRTTKGGQEPSEEEVKTLLSEDSNIITRRTITEAQITAAYLSGQEVRSSLTYASAFSCLTSVCFARDSVYGQ